MTHPLPKYHRRSTRLEDYDYAQAGVYFVTICTYERECLFGELSNGTLRLNESGEVVTQCWDALPTHFVAVELDEFVVMPNHVHGLVTLSSIVGAQHAAPVPLLSNASMPSKPENAINVMPGSLGAIVRSFKSAVTKRLHELQPDSRLPIWQRNYYDHIIRNDRELAAIRRYIYNNPLQWSLDRDNPTNYQPIAHSVAPYLHEAMG